MILKGLNVKNLDVTVTNMGMANDMSENMLFEILIFANWFGFDCG